MNRTDMVRRCVIWSVLGMTALAGSLVVLSARQGVPVRSDGDASGALTALDYFEIQQLSARYAHGMATGAGDGAMAANVFTPDGRLLDAGGRRVEGRPAIAALAREDPESRKGPTNVAEFVANLVLSPVPGGAVARTYVLFAAKPAPGQLRGVVTAGGQYFDDLVRTPEGWRISRRVFVSSDGPRPDAPRAAAVQPFTGPPPARGTLGLTADDFAGIQRLYADYGHTFDTGSEKGYGWANLYTADGVHVNVVNPLEYIKGRDLLAAFAFGAYRVGGGWATFNPAQRPTKTLVSAAHIQTSILLEPTPDGVVGKPYRLTGALGADDRVTLTPGGVYYDLLTQDVERWRFAASWYLLPGLKVPDAIARFVSPVPPGVYEVPFPSNVAGGLTADDDVEIHQLYARAAHALDSGAEAGRDYADVFTDDGVLTDLAGTTHRGRTALAAYANGPARTRRGPTHVEEFVWQIQTGPPARLDGSRLELRSRAYVVTLNLGTVPIVTNGGQYWDDLVKTTAGWRIRTRVFHRVGRNQPGGTP